MAEIALRQNQIDKLREEIKLVKEQVKESKKQIINNRILGVNKKSATKVMQDYFGTTNKQTTGELGL